MMWRLFGTGVVPEFIEGILALLGVCFGASALAAVAGYATGAGDVATLAAATAAISAVAFIMLRVGWGHR